MPPTAELCPPGAAAARRRPRPRLYTNAIYFWGNTAITALAGLGVLALFAALRDSEEVGLGTAAASVMMLLVMLSHLGLGSGLIRFVPEAGRQGPMMVNTALSLGALLGAVTSAVFLLGLPLWAGRLRFLGHDPLLAFSFILFTAAGTVFWIQDQALVAVRRGEHLLLRNILHNLMRLLLPLALLAALGGASGIVVSIGVPTLISAGLGVVLVLPVALPGYRPRPALPRELVAHLLPFSAGTYMSELFMAAPGLVLPIMVLNLRSSEEGAYFYAAWFLGYLLSTISFSLALSLFAEGSHNQPELPRLLRASLLRALILAAMGAVAVLLLADKLLLVFGHEYSQNAASLLRVVALAALPAAITNLYLAGERVRKRVASLTLVSGFVAAVTLGTSYVLLPGMGLVGAGIGILAGQGLGAALALALGFPHYSAPTAHPSTTEKPGAVAAPPRSAAFGRPTVSVVICALNEASNLAHVLPRIPTTVDEVILVDGHSADNTVEVARGLRPDIRVLYQDGQGKGNALRYGVQHASGEVIVTLDADGETDPQELPSFVNRLLLGHDFVKGSRFARGWRNKPWHRLLGNFLIVSTCNLLFRTRFSDLCSGYNTFWRDVAQRVNLWAEDDWNYEPLIIARLLRAGMDVVEEPQTYRGRVSDTSKLSSWTQGFTAIRVLLRERFRAREEVIATGRRA